MKITILNPNPTPELPSPNDDSQVSSEFSSPAEDNLESTLDLNRTLIKNPISTFYGRVKGGSIKDAGVDDGDLLVIDKSLDYRNNAVVVYYINGEFTLKYQVKGNTLLLMPANQDYQPIVVKEDDEFTIWEIVSYVIKKT